MKNAKNIAIGVLAIGVLAIVGQMCGAIGSVSETVQVMPDELAGAAATRTAIAPAIVPTVRYNDVVLPTQQAVEADEITETIERKYENARQWDDFIALCKKAFVGGLTVFSTIAQASGAGALVGAVLCYIIERVKRARAYEPIQVLPDKALYYPRYNMLADTRTARTWKVTTYSDADVDHGAILVDRLLTNGKRPRFQFRNEERHPATVLDAVKLPAQIQTHVAPEPDVIGA